MSRAALRLVVQELLARNGIAKGIVYIQATRGVAPRDHKFPQQSRTSLVVTARPLKPLPASLIEKGAEVITIPDIRWQRCDIKTIQLLPNVLAKQAAVERGALDAIMIRDGVATEGSHANVFAVVDGVLRTHPTDHHILPGITRAVVLELARDAGIPTLEEPLTEAELASADELFLAGTTTDVMPIVRLNDAEIGSGQPGPITTRLIREFRVCLDVACGVVSTTA